MPSATILCVDRDPSILLTLRAQLSQALPDYQLALAQEPEAALRQVEALARDVAEVPLVIAGAAMAQGQWLSTVYGHFPGALTILLVEPTAPRVAPEAIPPDSLYHYRPTPWDETDLRLTVAQALRCYRQTRQLAQQHAALVEARQQIADLDQQLHGVLGHLHNLEHQLSHLAQIVPERQQLLKQLSDLEFAIDQAAIVATTDAQGRITAVNDRFCTISQYSRQELIGQTHQLINSGYHSREFFQDLWQTIRSGQVWRGEIKNRAKDGSEYWVDTVIVPFVDEQGQPLQYLAIRFETTERKRAEAALQRSQKNLTEAQRIAQLGSWEFDLATQTITWSEETFRIFGLDPAQPEPDYETWQQLIHPDDWLRLEGVIEQTIVTGQPYKVEHRIIRPNGDLRYLLGYGEAVLNAQGQVIKLLGTGQDITDLKRTELALQASEAKNRAILAAIPDMLTVTDAQGLILHFSHNQFKGATLRPDERTGLNIADVWPLELVNQYLAALEQALATGTVQTYEQQLTFGELIQYEEVRVAPLQDDQVLCMVRDVSDRKQAEEARRQSEEQLQRLAENLPGVVFRYVLRADGSDGFAYLSAQCYEVFGITAETAIADSRRLWAIVHPDDIAALAESVAASAANPTQPFYSEYRIITPAGQPKWLRVTTSVPTHGDAGELIWNGFIDDTTEQKVAELEVRRNSELREVIFNESTDALFLVDRQTLLITDCNERAMALFEAESKADLLGIEGNTLQRHPFAAEELTQIRQELIQQGFWSREIEYVTFNGHSFWGNIAAKPIMVADAAMTLVRITDITEQKRIETQIRLSEQQLQLTLAFTGIGAWRWHPGTGEYAWNGNMEAMLEIPPGLENMHEIWRDRVHPDDVERVEATIENSIMTGFPFVEEYRYRRLDGRWVWLWVRAKGIYTETGQLEQVLGVVQDITDRKRTEMALQQSQEQLSLAVEFGRVAIWNWDVSTDQLAWNDISFEILGYEPGSFEPTYADWLQAVHPEDRDATTQTIDQALREGQPAVNVEYRVIRPDGTQRWLLGSGRGIYDADGHLVRAAGIMLDITERKTAELALSQWQAQIQAISANLPGFFYRCLVDAQGRLTLTYVSAGAETVFRQPIAGVQAEQLLQQLHPDDITKAQAIVAGDGLPLLPSHTELRFLDPAGAVIWVSLHFQAHPAEAGDGLVFDGICLDITEKKQLELERQQAELALQESEARFRGIAETVQEGFFDFDVLSGRYTYLNPACTAITGISEREFETVTTLLAHIHPDDIERITTALQRQAQGDIFDEEYRFVRPSGEVRWLCSQGYPIHNEAGMVARVVGTVQDITDRKRDELALNQAQERYSLATQAARVGVWEWNLKTNDFYLDPNVKALLGYSDDEIPNDLTQWINHVHPDDVEAVQTIAQDHIEGKTPEYLCEYRMLHKNGSIVWILVRGKVLLDDQGQPDRMVGTNTDISDLKRAELALKQLNNQLEQRVQERTQELQKFAALVENSTDLIGMATLEGEAIYLNQAGHHLLGVAEDDLVGRSVTTFLQPSELTRFTQEAIPAALQHGFWQGEAIFRHLQTGAAVTLEQAIFVIRDAQTSAPICLATICRDIRDRKRAELALQESETRFRQIAETIQDVFWMTTLDSSEVLYVSPAFEQVWGLSCEHLYQWPQAWFESIHPEDQPAVKRLLQVPQESEGYDRIYRICRPSGELRWIHDQAFPVLDEAGEVYRLVGVAKDITERKQAELALQESEVRFRQLFSATPTPIQGYDQDRRVIFWNQASEAIYGYTEAEALGQRVEDLIIPEAIQAAVLPVVDAWITGNGAPLPNGELWLQHKTGKMVPVYSTRVKLNSLSGGPEMYCIDVDLAEIKQAELALRDSEERFRQIAETIQEVFWMTAPDNGEVLYLSPAFEDIWGVPADTIYQDPSAWLKALHPDDQPRVLEAIESRTAQGGEDIYRIIRSDGELRWIHDRAFPVRDEAGEVYRVVGLAKDITESKLSQLQLQDSEQRFRATFEQAAVGMVQADLAGRLTRANQRFCDFLGYSATELYTKTYADITHPDDLTDDRANVERLLVGEGSSFAMEKRYLRADNTVVWADLVVSLICDVEGNPQYFIAVANDITDRKQAELALIESQQFNQRITESAPYIIYIYDLENQINIYVNRGVLNTLGYSPESIKAMGSQVLSTLLHPDDLASLGDILDQIRAASDDDVVETEYRMRDAKGRWCWLYDRRAVFKRDPQGRVIQHIGIVQDITDRKQAEEALKQLNLELEQRVETRTQELQQAMETAEGANRAKSTFLANMSHELRTPLNAILGFTQLMARDLALSVDNRQYLAIINRSGEHLLNLINDVLEMSKIEAGQVQVNLETCDLHNLMETLKDMFDLRARHKGLNLVIERHSSLPRYVETDEHKLRQVLINLVGNAIKFTANGQVALRVVPDTCWVAVADSEASLALTFTIDDTGIGIDPSDIDSLFQPFTQVKQTNGSQEGTGLGLPISRQFVRLLGGELMVDSQPGLGTTFRFTISVKVVDWATEAALSAVAEEVVGLAPGQPSYRILVTDDNDAHRQLLVRLLNSIGLEVREANQGQAAIALWQSWQPHLILMDMRMPGLDGYTATQRIRELETGQEHTKIIALTANAFEENRAQALSSGCDDFMRKPFQIAQLLEKMADHLGLQYRYEESASTVAPSLSSTEPSAALAELQALPEPAFKQIYQATLRLDSQQLADLVTQLAPEHPALSQWLHQKLDDFALDQVHELLQQAKPNLTLP